MNSDTRGEIVDEASKWLVGGGILTMALAPLALPGIVLLLIAALPLAILAVPLVLVGGLGFWVIRLVRGAGHLAVRLRQSEQRTEGEPIPIPAPHGS
jgi:hypothetical protein